MRRLTNKELKEACLQRRDREIREWMQEDVDSLSNKESSRPVKSRHIGRWVATAAALILAMLAGWLLLDPAAYARAESWVQEKIRIVSSNKDAVFPSYHLGWKPERFQHLFYQLDEEYYYQEEYDNYHIEAISMDEWEQLYGKDPERAERVTPGPGKVWAIGKEERRQRFVWAYEKFSERGEITVSSRLYEESGEWGEDLESDSWVSGDWHVYYNKTRSYGVETNEQGESVKIPDDIIYCTLVDEKRDVLFYLAGNITKEEAMKIIENIVIDKKE